MNVQLIERRQRRRSWRLRLFAGELAVDVGKAAAGANVGASCLNSTIAALAFREQDRAAHHRIAAARSPRTAWQLETVVVLPSAAVIRRRSAIFPSRRRIAVRRRRTVTVLRRRPTIRPTATRAGKLPVDIGDIAAASANCEPRRNALSRSCQAEGRQHDPVESNVLT